MTGRPVGLVERSMTVLIMILATLLGAVRAGADPLAPNALDVGGWTNGESRDFVLSWDGGTAALWLDDGLAGSSGSLETCCDDVLVPLLESGPGATLTLSELTFNSLPVDSDIVLGWGLSPLEVLRRTGLENLVRLEGTMTLSWVDLQASPGLVFDTVAADGTIPEPPTLFLLWAMLAGLAVRRLGPRR